MKSFTQFIAEDAPANAAGSGGVAGIGVGPKGEPGVRLKKKKQDGLVASQRYITVGELKEAGKRFRADLHEEDETFAGTKVFEVPSDTMHKSLHGKKRYHRYSRYVGTDEVGEAIRTHGRAGHAVILKDAATAVMTYLRRKKA